MNKKDIFISYSSTQSEIAFSVRNFLEKQGISCWIAPDCIPNGDDYSKAIPTAINNCSALLLILSEASQYSKWVKKEIENAISLKKQIIAVSIENFSINNEFEFYLSTVKTFNLYTDKKDALLNLVNEINSILSRELCDISEDELNETMSIIKKEFEFLGSFMKGAPGKIKIFSIYWILAIVLPLLFFALYGGFMVLKLILFPPKFY